LAVDKPIIGFVSADFKAHPVGWFLKAILPKLREKYHIYAYANQSNCDFLTQEIISNVDRWNVVLGISDDYLANKIREDRVDILVDLSGHTSGNRLGVFSLRAAPIQVSWLGYFSTTGISEMDYVFMDEEHVPNELEKFFSEKVMRINPIRLCYSPPVYAPEVAALPMKLNGYVTFGSFNNSSKLNDFTIQMWSKILKDIPNSRLILKWRTFADFGMRSRVRSDFLKYGIEPGRLQFSQSSSHDIMLAEYSEIDIALDPYPFTGATTTCEAMWMGVPVITLRGDKPVSRQSSAMLKAVGLENLIADSVDQYIQIAKKLASDTAKLSQIRSTLRLKLKDSYLCEPGKFTDGLLTAFEKTIIDYTKCE
jgi:predicted O-linked N-acetylglucosamine transferase (SPINDLY family)